MSPLLIKISKDFATIWTTIDPIGNVAIFAGLTASLTRAERRRTALRATVYAAIILVVAVVAGQIILDAIGIHLHSGSRHSCSCYGDHSCLTRGGNRADDIGSGKLGARSALEFVQMRAASPVYFFFRNCMTPSAMHSHLPLRSVQVSTQT